MRHEQKLSIRSLYCLPSIRDCTFTFFQVIVHICFRPVCFHSLSLAHESIRFFSSIIWHHRVIKTSSRHYWKYDGFIWLRKIWSSLRLKTARLIQTLCVFGIKILLLQYRKQPTALRCTIMFLPHSCLLLVAFKERMARLNFISITKKARTQTHVVRNSCFLCCTKLSTSEIQIMFPICCLKWRLNEAYIPSPHFENGCALCAIYLTLSAHTL